MYVCDLQYLWGKKEKKINNPEPVQLPDRSRVSNDVTRMLWLVLLSPGHVFSNTIWENDNQKTINND